MTYSRTGKSFTLFLSPIPGYIRYIQVCGVSEKSSKYRYNLPRNVFVGYEGFGIQSAPLVSSMYTGPSFHIKSKPPTRFSRPVNLRVAKIRHS